MASPSAAAATARAVFRSNLRAAAAPGEMTVAADPVVFAWRAAPSHHAAAAALAVGIGMPLVWLALLVVRDLIQVLLGPPTDAVVFLALTLDLPARWGGSRVLWPGWSVPRAEFGLLAPTVLIGLGMLAAGCGWLAARTAFAAETRAVARLRRLAVDATLAAGRDDVRGLAAQVGGALRASEGWLAGAVLIPALAAGTTLLALGFAAALRPQLALVLVAALAMVGVLRHTLLARRERGAHLRRSEGATLEAALADLVRRLPAVRAHGTAAYERARLSADARARRLALGDALSSSGRTRALAIALSGLLTAFLLASLLADGPGAPISAGGFATALASFAIAARGVTALVRARVSLREAAPYLARVSQTLAAIERRAFDRARQTDATTTLPGEGDLVLEGASAYDPGSGERLTTVDLRLRMPSHVAIVGPRGSGARVLAALAAGQLAPSAGRVTLAGHDLARLTSPARAARIGYAASDAVLVAGTLLENLLYGCADAPADLEARLGDALVATGLDRFVYARGLSGTIDPRREAGIAPTLVTARGALREALVAEAAEGLVEPFDPERYNRHATLGKNILFGEPVGDHFVEARLARHPFLQAVLEAEGLTRPLAELGLAVARSTVEIFADLPDDHPLFDAFSLFPSSERGFFEDLVARQQDARTLRRGPAGRATARA